MSLYKQVKLTLHHFKHCEVKQLGDILYIHAHVRVVQLRLQLVITYDKQTVP